MTPSTAKPVSIWRRFVNSDLLFSFLRSPVAMAAALTALLCAIAAVFAPWLAPFNTNDPANVDLINALLPPSWIQGGDARFFFGTDGQGRDVYSALFYGARLSLFIGLVAVLLSLTLGVGLGLMAGYLGGKVDATIMRVCDVMLSFPSILVALLINGVAKTVYPNASDSMAVAVLIVAIALSGWVQYARTVRGSTLVERQKEYVQAARVVGVSSLRIMRKHVLPNVLGPVFVLATIQVGTAIITEATLSFLGVGVPSTSPSLGTLIRVGREFLYAGDWWITWLPAIVLMVIAFSVNLLGDWLRDALNPRLR